MRAASVTTSISVPSGVTDISFDFNKIAIAASTKSVMLYSRADETIKEHAGHSKTVRSCRLLGNRLVSGGMDSMIRISDIQ